MSLLFFFLFFSCGIFNLYTCFGHIRLVPRAFADGYRDHQRLGAPRTFYKQGSKSRYWVMIMSLTAFGINQIASNILH